jgi:hypothetical protein
MDRRIEGLLLLGAVLVPIVYFGAQLVLAPLFPGYNPVRDVASLLGSDRAVHAAWFNGAAIASGMCAFAGAIGVFRALAGAAPAWLRYVLLAALLLLGCGNVWAGVFTLPDPRHGANPFTPAYLAMPALLCLAAWTAPALRGLRPYLTLNLLGFVAMVPVMAGLTGIDPVAYAGLLQRLVALAMIAPVGVVGWHLLRRMPS